MEGGGEGLCGDGASMMAGMCKLGWVASGLLWVGDEVSNEVVERVRLRGPSGVIVGRTRKAAALCKAEAVAFSGSSAMLSRLM